MARATLNRITNYTLRLDTDTKAQAQELFEYLGLDMATAIKMFLRQAIECQGLPFPVERRTVKEGTMTAIDNAVVGKNLSPAYTSLDSLWKDLEA